jgi:hypothetical protein
VATKIGDVGGLHHRPCSPRSVRVT